jgi:hypothetical protein
MATGADTHRFVDLHGGRYPWVYWTATVAAFAFLIVDIFDDSAVWNYVVIALIIVAVAVRRVGR